MRSVVVELNAATVPQLQSRIERMKQREERLETAYSGIKNTVPLLHFMSITIFRDAQYDPVLVLEVNFDGPPGPFWTGFEYAFGEDLRAMLRCGKIPRDNRGALFQSVTRPGSRAPIAPLLEALTVSPAIAHQGNRGLDRARIEADGKLFAAAQTLIDADELPYDATPVQIHQAMRQALLPRFGWLEQPAPARIGAAENRADWLRLTAFVCAVLFAACLPGVLVSLVLPPAAAFAVLVAAGAFLWPRLDLPKDARHMPGMVGKLPLILGALLIFWLALSMLFAIPSAIHHWHIERYGRHVGDCAVHVAIGFVGLFPAIAGLLLWVRAAETRDAPQDAPERNDAALRAMAVHEDMTTQNHMGSLVHLKPGILRAVLVRVALLGLGLFLRVQARDGYLGSMRTIHFAHWALISNGSRLLFFSNFDGSWESYLDDFIDKAHSGLTLAWTSGVGFPPTRFLMSEGATQGRKFKAWARHSMAVSLFWYSAYDGFTVNQVERQVRVAEGLRRATLSEKEAAAWAMEL